MVRICNHDQGTRQRQADGTAEMLPCEEAASTILRRDVGSTHCSANTCSLTSVCLHQP